MKVSIGIPTFNQQNYICEAVDSALAQTWPNLEVIVSDDASNDSTADLLEKYKQDPRFKYYKNENNIGRVANYRRLLYELASGEWYINMDGDDYFTDPDFISNAVDLVKAHSSAIAVIADCKVKDESSVKEWSYESNYADGQSVNGSNFLDDVQAGKAQTTHLTTLYKASAAKAIDFYRADILGSDFESIYRLALHGDIVYLKKTVATWRKHGNNAADVNNLKATLENLTLPAAVGKYAKTLGTNLNHWERSMRRNMIAAALVESRQKGILVKTLFSLLAKYPAATLKTIINPKAVSKHLGKK